MSGTEIYSVEWLRQQQLNKKGRVVLSPAPTVSAKPAVKQKESPKRGKYGNKPVPDPRGGKDFDSTLEGKHGIEYYLMEEKGLIAKVERQVEYVLHAGVKYRADFLITHLDGSLEVVDSKGVETEVFRIKRKLFIADYPHIKFTTRKAKEKKSKGKKKGDR